MSCNFQMFLIRFCHRIENRVVFVNEMFKFLRFSIYVTTKRENFIP